MKKKSWAISEEIWILPFFEKKKNNFNVSQIKTVPLII